MEEAESRGIEVFIAGAGFAAHLAGVIAAHTVLPVIGVPIDSSALAGVGALYSTVQMPGGIPVATMSIGKAGARNAGLFAVQILSRKDPALVDKLKEYRRQMREQVLAIRLEGRGEPLSSRRTFRSRRNRRPSSGDKASGRGGTSSRSPAGNTCRARCHRSG